MSVKIYLAARYPGAGALTPDYEPPAAAASEAAAPIAFRFDWPAEFSVGARRFAGADDPVVERFRSQGIATLVPLYAAPQPPAA